MATSSNIGQLDSFDDALEEFSLYVERMDQYFAANLIGDDRKVAVFLALLGPRTYKLLRNLLQPRLPKGETYQVLVETLSEYYKPTPIIIAERFRFHRRNQHAQESIAAYVVELKRLAASCNFGSFLDEAIRDRFVCGMGCDATQKRLLAKKDLTLRDAVSIAQAMESAEKNNVDLKQDVAYANQISKPPTERQNEAENHQTVNLVTQKKKGLCYRCGAKHDQKSCKYKNATCYTCKKTGHISPVCMSGTKFSNKGSIKALQKEEWSSSSESLNLYAVNDMLKKNKGYAMPVEIYNKRLIMSLDTAADVSTVSKHWLETNLPSVKISNSNIVVKDYNKADIEILGKITVPVNYKGQVKTLNVYVVNGDRSALFGKDFIGAFTIEWGEIFSASVSEQLQEGCILKNCDVFSSNGRPIKNFKANIKMVKDCKPMFRKNRNVPYALKSVVADEIDKNAKRGIWDYVQHSRWATPIVVVPKKDGSVRICGDFKITVNQEIDVNQYPLPTQQDLFTTLNGNKYFTKLDLANAYQQVELDESSQELLTLNTHLGLVRPKRLLYGVANAAAVFQSIMDQILQGLDGVICYQDDILVMGPTRVVHDKNLQKVLHRLDDHNVKLNRKKCSFSQTKIEYLGHIVDEQGIRPTEEKIVAIKKISSPESVTQLRSFLGILNYYIKFIKNASTLLEPLHKLLRENVAWEWSPACESTFQTCKSLLTSQTVLVHYDPKKRLKLACDASPYGLGAIISHIMKNGDERPIAYASRTLTTAESNYPQIEREALSIIFGLKKFEQYLYGKEFTIVTDHRPLLAIFGPKTNMPSLAAARLQRWSLLLGNYKYNIEYKKGAEHSNVDTLSRHPIPTSDGLKEIFKISYADELPIVSKDISAATRVDPILGPVCNYVRYGWRDANVDELRPFVSRKDELSLDNGCLTWGMRVIIPASLRRQLLELLHDTHPGITKMKQIARSHIWWPGLDQDIETLSKQCPACSQVSKMPPVTPMQSWVWPSGPWQRIHVDFAQKGYRYYLIIVDAHSKWLEVEPMNDITAKQTIRKLREMFSRYGLPRELVSDNGPQFISNEFETFLKLNGVKHTLTPAYHPQSNGAAERMVQHFKTALEKMTHDKKDNTELEHKISRFLFIQHTTQHATTGRTPSELFMGRHLRTKLTMVHPDIQSDVESKQLIQKKQYDRKHATQRSVDVGSRVLVKQLNLGNLGWKEGIVSEKVGSNTWKVRINDSNKLVHIDQMKTNCIPDTEDTEQSITNCESTEDNNETTGTLSEDIVNPQDDEPLSVDITNEIRSPQLPRRNPPRLRSKPKKLDL